MTTKIKSGVISDNAITSVHISSGAISSTHLTGIDTDAVSEGSSNLYFTTTRARTSLSVTDSGGDGSLTYDNSTGAITYTGPSASEVRAHLSAGTGVTYSSGEFSIGQSVATTASPTFADINITGDLNITGDINSLSVTDLDVTDKTITLGVGQSESASGGSGIVVDGSSASLLWDESNDEWDFNKAINVTGTITSSGNITGTLATAAQPNITSVGTLTGLTTTGNINFGDDDRAIFGAGSDLQIYHNGNNSFIDEVGTGILYIRAATDLRLTNADSSKIYANFQDGGPSKLYHDNALKLLTTSTGIDVTGTLTADNSINVNDASGYGSIELGGASGGFIDFKTPFSDDKDARIIYQGTNFQISTHLDQPILIKHNTATVLETSSSGIEITGTVIADGLTVDTTTLHVDSTNNRVGIGTNSPDNLLHIAGASGSAILNIQRTDTNTTGSSGIIGFSNSDGYFLASVQAEGDGDNNGADLIFRATSSTDSTIDNPWEVTERMRIHADTGSVSIGTSSDLGKLTISNNGAEGFEFSPGVTNFGIANTNYIASYDRSANTYRDISFDVGGAETQSIRFKSGGRVGIGVASPLKSLHVNNATGIQISDTATSANTRTTFSPEDSGGNSLLKIKGGSYYHRVAYETSWNNFEYAKLTSSYNTTHTIFDLNQSASDGTTAATTRISTGDSYFAGDVGIGTSDPDQQLHIEGSSPAIRLESTGSSGGVIVIGEGNNDKAFFGTANHLISGDSVNNAAIRANSKFSIATGSSGTRRFRIDENGQSIIGTAAISGNVATHGVILSDTGKNGNLSTTLGDAQRVVAFHNQSHNQDYLTFRTRRITDGQAGWNHAVWDITRDIDSTSNLYKYLTFGIGELVVNDESSATMDFRVEGNNNTHLIHADASSDRVGIAKSTPATTLHIGSGQSNYVRIENAASGDISSGYQIYRGASTVGMNLYDNPADNTTSLQVAGALNINAGGSGADLSIDSNGNMTATAKFARSNFQWGSGEDNFKIYNLSGPTGSSTLVRTVDVNSYWGYNAQGGFFMYAIHGWASDEAAGLVSWRNNGSNAQVITDVYHRPFFTTTFDSVSVAKGSGDREIDITLTGTHSNTHGWRWVVWA